MRDTCMMGVRRVSDDGGHGGWEGSGKEGKGGG